MRRVPAGSGSTTRPSASDTGAPGVTASPPDDPIGPIGQGPPRSRSVPRGPRRRRRAEPRSADQAEGTDDGVVEARPEVADPGLRAPEDGAIGTEGDGQPAREVDPQAHA